MAIIASLTVLATSSAAPIPHPRRLASLSLRTENWVFVTLDGHDLGYAPLFLTLTAEVSHQLRWKSAAAHGEIVVRLKPQEHLTLEDSDFSH